MSLLPALAGFPMVTRRWAGEIRFSGWRAPVRYVPLRRMPGLGLKSGLLQPRRKYRELLSQCTGQLWVRRSHGHVNFAAALGQQDVHALFAPIQLHLNCVGR
jgi:hypothetical protein